MSDNPLAHLLACLDRAVVLMDECGFDCDARVVEAHRAQLARGREWYGDPINPVTFPDGSTNGEVTLLPSALSGDTEGKP